MAERHRRQVGGVAVIEVDANPNGSLSGERGTFALDRTNGRVFVNTDGGTTWADPLGGASYTLRWGVRTQGFGSGNYWIANSWAGGTQRGTNETEVQVRQPVPRSGQIKAMAWVSASGDATTQAVIVIDGSDASTVTWTGAIGAVTGLSISVTQGSRIALRLGNGTGPGESMVLLLIEE